MRTLIKNELAKNPSLAIKISACMSEGKMVPDDIVTPLIVKRINEPDCKINGWVLDGFPQNEAQINLLKSLKFKPSHVFLLDQLEAVSLRRLQARRIDLETGRVYNIKEFPPTDEDVLKRLTELPEDSDKILKLRIANWANNLYLIEEEFGEQLTTIPADQSVIEVTKTIGEVILPAHELARVK